MCYKQVRHIHCSNCNKDLWPNTPFETDVFCASGKTNKLSNIEKCSQYKPPNHVYEKAPKDDCYSCVMKRK
jgi:hypothetical protein